MKAITLWQPWASLVVVGAKQYETRSWPTTYRGPLAIHAAKKQDVLAQVLRGEGPFVFLREILRRFDLASIDRFPLGAIVGTCDVVDCSPTDWLKPSTEEQAVGDFTAGRFGWKLQNPRRMEPVEAAGAQGFWTWSSPADAARPAVVERGLFDETAS